MARSAERGTTARLAGRAAGAGGSSPATEKLHLVVDATTLLFTSSDTWDDDVIDAIRAVYRLARETNAEMSR